MRWTLVVAFTCAAAFAQQPRIDAISPPRGPIAGGAIVTISGANLAGTTVMLDRASVVPLSQTDAQLTLRMPAHANGYAIIGASNADGVAYARFFYVPPRLDELQPGEITTIAGIGDYGGEYGPAREAELRSPWGVAYGRDGLLYFTSASNSRVMRVRADGILEPFAGNGGIAGPHPPGLTPALDVQVDFPRSLAFDSHGNMIVPDSNFAFYIWRITPAGLAELIAGTGQNSHNVVDGVPAKGTAIGEPNYVAVDADDNIYFIDFTNARIRKIDRDGILSTVAGNGSYGFSGDGGPATSAQFNLAYNDIGGLAIDPDGNILLLDTSNQRIRRISKSTGVIETIAGPTFNGHQLDNIRAMTVAPNGDLYFGNASELYRRRTDGTIQLIPNGGHGFSEDGARLPAAPMSSFLGMTIDPHGDLVYVDADVRRIRKLDLTTLTISTLAGIGPRNMGEDGPAIAAAITGHDDDIDLLPSGEMVVADTDRIEKIDAAGRWVRFAGSGVFGASDDLPALQSNAMAPFSSAASPNGVVDYADGGWVARVDSDGIVRRTAGGDFQCKFSGDGGDARLAQLCQTWDALRDRDGNLLIADTNNNRVRRVDHQSGIITTIVGSGKPNGAEGYGAGTTCGDGGAATSACVNTPYGLAFDDGGNLLVSENQDRIRRIDRSGVISTFADAHCTKITWAFGHLFAVGGDFVFSVSRSGRITPLTRMGASRGFGGDGGLSRDAQIGFQFQSSGIAVDGHGNVFFNDGSNLRVRAIRYGAVLAPSGATVQATANGKVIRASVADDLAQPAEGVRVDFAVPASGASCTLSSPFAITDANGIATVTCTPNCLAGKYSVAATPLAAPVSAAVQFTNAGYPCRGRAVRH